VYPDYCYPLRGQGKKRKTAASTKAAASAKTAASATPDEPPKRQKLKVLTHRPRYIEPAVVPEFGGETSSPADPKEPIPPTQKAEELATMPKASSAELAESKADRDKAEEPKTEEAKKVRNFKPFDGSNSAEGTKKSCGNPEKKKDGKCTGRARNSKGFKLYSFRENS
jgi:hypothetical protein